MTGGGPLSHLDELEELYARDLRVLPELCRSGRVEAFNLRLLRLETLY